MPLAMSIITGAAVGVFVGVIATTAGAEVARALPIGTAIGAGIGVIVGTILTRRG